MIQRLIEQRFESWRGITPKDSFHSGLERDFHALKLARGDLLKQQRLDGWC